MRNDDNPLERLQTIRRLMIEARDIADAEDEHMIGAKLDDCVTCADERIATFDR